MTEFTLPTKEELASQAQDYGLDLAEHHVRHRGYGDFLDAYDAAEAYFAENGGGTVRMNPQTPLTPEQQKQLDAIGFPFTDDAYWDTCNFMAQAMIKEASSTEAHILASLNEETGFFDKQIISAAKDILNIDATQKIEGEPLGLAVFYALADNHGPWDYKPILERRGSLIETGFKNKSGRFLGTTIPGDKEYLYFYDLWSNIIFGFIGRSCGFTEETLLAGATRHDRMIGGLNKAESYSDVLSIQIGFRLFDIGSVSPMVITGELQYASKFFVEGITKHHFVNLVLQTMTNTDQKKQYPEWYEAMMVER